MEERYNKILDISFKFGVRIVKLSQYLIDNKISHTISNQVLRSGTSIGANVNESIFAQSKKDFITKMHIALKEANETKYWIEVIYRSELMSKDKYSELTNDVGELYKILAASIRTAKGNMG